MRPAASAATSASVSTWRPRPTLTSSACGQGGERGRVDDVLRLGVSASATTTASASATTSCRSSSVPVRSAPGNGSGRRRSTVTRQRNGASSGSSARVISPPPSTTTCAVEQVPSDRSSTSSHARSRRGRASRRAASRGPSPRPGRRRRPSLTSRCGRGSRCPRNGSMPAKGSWTQRMPGPAASSGRAATGRAGRARRAPRRPSGSSTMVPPPRSIAARIVGRGLPRGDEDAWRSGAVASWSRVAHGRLSSDGRRGTSSANVSPRCTKSRKAPKLGAAGDRSTAPPSG
jgi:hypothetical protein